MSTVLVVEDEFIASYDLEVRLKEKGYAVQLAATKAAAVQLFARLSKSRDLAAVVCDNRLINGKPAAVSVYHRVRSQNAKVPFVVYSGFPPHDLPRDDAMRRSFRSLPSMT
jgi:DNA-binding NtrC family response regulator